jgi:adenosylmethionine-8-amino-7-oxononanoate aminotransferase
MEFFINESLLKKQKNISSTQDYTISYEDGTKSIDILMGNTSYIFGYTDKEILTAVKNANVQFIKNSYLEKSTELEHVVKNMFHHSGMKGISWTLSGTDAVEHGVHMNDAYWRKVNPKKTKILSLYPSYHGSSYLTIALRGEYKTDRNVLVKAPIWTDVEKREQEENKCLSKIETRLKRDSDIGLLVVESIPWIDGCKKFSNDFWKRARNICDQYDVNLMIDDCAGSFGKMGKVFSHTSFGIQPDIVVCAKALTGGYTPLSAALCNEKIEEVLRKDNWSHTHTWTPNAVGIACASVVFDKINNGAYDIIPEINSKMKDTLNDTPFKWRDNGGLLFDIIYDGDMEGLLERLWNNGISITPWRNSLYAKSIPICVPLIADDNYFNEIKRILTESF